jgi:hypothetical protein
MIIVVPPRFTAHEALIVTPHKKQDTHTTRAVRAPGLKDEAFILGVKDQRKSSMAQ